MNNQQITPDDRSEAPQSPLPLPNRLHPSTLWLPLLASLRGALVFGVFFSFVMGIKTAALSVFVFFLLPTSIYHLLRYVTVRYQLSQTELFIRSGLFWKQERRIPLKRFQDIEIRQSFLHRMFKMTKVVIKTASSDEEEAVLEVLEENEAQHFKKSIIESQSLIRSDTGSAAGTQTEETLLRLSLKELILGGLSSRIAGTLGALIGVIIYFWVVLYIGSLLKLEDFEVPDFNPFPDWTDYLPIQGTVFEPALSVFLNDTLSKSVFLILVGFLFSLTRFIFRHFHYHLTQTGRVLTTTEGLLTSRSASLARNRVQALKIEETILRRWFKLAEIWVDSAGDRSKVDDEKKRESFVPVMSRTGAFELVQEIMDQLPNAEPEWKRISRKSIFRGSRVGWLILVLIIAQCAVAFGWLTLIWLPGFPLIYLYNVKRFRITGYWYDPHHLIYRKGWFNRKTLYLPIKNIQNVMLTQNPFDRRLDLGSITLDTAGQSNTGGGAVIRHLPIREARQMQRFLAVRVASMRFDW